MRVTIVGSGTLLPNDRHRSPGHLVETGQATLLLDCGSGVLHGLARDRRDWQAISHVAITHFHTDHFGDLPALLWAWTHGVPKEDQRPRVLLGPPGLERVLTLLTEVHGDHVLRPGCSLEVIELGPRDAWEDPSAELRLQTHATRHTKESVAYRVEADGSTVCYTGDTGPHPPLGVFFRGTELLIAECSTPDHARVENHLSPAEAAELAIAAQARTLVLTHLYPGVERDGLTELIAAFGFRGTVLVAEDGLAIEL